LALALLAGQAAFADIVKLFLKTGSTSQELDGDVGGVFFPFLNIGGWEVDRITGTSNSTTTSPFGELTLQADAVTCTSTSCLTNPLDMWLSDTGFGTMNTGFDNAYSARIKGAGTTEQKAWVGLGNIPFESDGADGLPTQTGGRLVGVVGPFTGPPGITSNFAGSASGGPAPQGRYSLTIEDIFNVNGHAGVSFDTGGSVTGVPEPSSVVLLGSLLLFCSSRLVRRKVF
jgi:hypothetical protein